MVARWHGWITRLAMNWVKYVQRKEVAQHKTTCIASCAVLRDRMADEMKDMGIPITLAGEVLGIDYTAGGEMRRRGTQIQRRRRATGRKKRLKWWKGLGGRAGRVAKSGAIPQLAYGSEVTGLPPSALRDARGIQGATTSTQCGGASLTAKLALGGDCYQDTEPGVLLHNPPLRAILTLIWDRPDAREDVVRAHYSARDKMREHGPTGFWRVVNGPVSAALAHAERVGVRWDKPFQLTALGHTINPLETPPKQTEQILREHARIQYDHLMLRRLAVRNEWDVDAIMQKYKHGINWALLRDVLCGRRGRLSPRERNILLVVATGGFWPEHRRWNNGLLESPECSACGHPMSTPWHRIHDCSATAATKCLLRAAGDAQRLPHVASDPALAPLAEMGLPPVSEPWAPTAEITTEDDMPLHVDGCLYGDGSGYYQERRDTRIATYSLVRMRPAADDASDIEARVAGVVGGWFPTVPRGELRALIEAMRHGGSATYFGDCKYVISGAEFGVSAKLKSSASADADLWRRVDAMARDHGTPPRVRKTRAHRSRSAATADSSDTIEHWIGNRAADFVAKAAARELVRSSDKRERIATDETTYCTVIQCVAQGAALAVERWPETAPRNSKRTNDRQRLGASAPEADDGDDVHVLRRIEGEKFECMICRSIAYSSRGARKLSNMICPGAVARTIHESHSLQRSHGVIWCGLCGSFSTRWPRQLQQVCPRKPRSQPQRNVLRRLLAGQPPTTASYLGDVARAGGAPVTTTDTITIVDKPVPPPADRGDCDEPDGYGVRPVCDDEVRADDLPPAHHVNHQHLHHGGDQAGSADGDGAQAIAEAAATASPSTALSSCISSGTAQSCTTSRAFYGYSRLVDAHARRQRASSGPPESRGNEFSEDAETPRAMMNVGVSQSSTSRPPSTCISGQHWMRRIAFQRSAASAPCATCGTAMTRLRCGTCKLSLCLGCARQSEGCEPCRSTSQPPV